MFLSITVLYEPIAFEVKGMQSARSEGWHGYALDSTVYSICCIISRIIAATCIRWYVL